jgi:hypothetical protein
MPENLARVVKAQVWYPAARDAGGERMPYFPRAGTHARLREIGYLRQPPERFDAWAHWTTHAERGALPAVRTGGFPLVLFTPSPPVPVQQYTALLQELASRGFVVLAVEPRVERTPAIRRSAWTPEQEENLRAADLSLVLRRFGSATGSVAAIAQRADLTRAAVLGHLNGVDAMLALCGSERVLQRCAALDGVPPDDALPGGAPLPLLVLRSGTTPADADLESDVRARWLTLFARGGDAPVRLLRLEGSGFMSATDAPWLMPDVARAAGAGPDARGTFDLTVELLTSFFEGPAEPFAGVDSLTAAYPELRVES